MQLHHSHRKPLRKEENTSLEKIRKKKKGREKKKIRKGEVKR
jgi:hypothetical protein